MSIQDDGSWTSNYKESDFLKASSAQPAIPIQTTHVGSGPPTAAPPRLAAQPDERPLNEGKLLVTFCEDYDFEKHKTAWLTPAGLKFLEQDDSIEVLKVQDANGTVLKDNMEVD